MQTSDALIQAEILRLAELHRLDVLDTPAEPAFDAITSIASSLYDVPIALISLIDASRQWWKSRCGLDGWGTPRELAFCDHAIRQSAVFIVEDAATHPRFRHNPLVTGEPHIRFYAGAPLVTSKGARIGTLCIIDRRTRPDIVAGDTAPLQQLARIVVDEFELRQANSELAETRRRLEAANVAKTKFITTVSHEIRTPIFAISSLTELAFSKARSPEQKHYLGLLRSVNQTLLGLLDDVIDVARLDRGEMPQKMTVFDVRDVLDRMMNILQVRAELRGLPLVLHVGSDVPARLVGDELRLFQILVNLVNNAIKFTEEGSVHVSVHVTERRRGSVRLRIDVRDTGVGIPEDRLASIFRAWEGVGDEAEMPRGSAGIGLAVVSRFVKVLGGRIEVSSVVGRGSTFTVSADFGVEEATGDPLDPIAEGAAGGRPRLAGLRILLVEDSEIAREAVKALLESAGAVVAVAEDGAQAVRLATDPGSAFDVVVMDVGLPDIDGIEATRQIRQALGPNAMPVIALSAHVSEVVARECLDAGFDAYLRKPASWGELLAALLQVTGRGEPEGMDAATEGPRPDGAAARAVIGSVPGLRDQLIAMFRQNYGQIAVTLDETIANGDTAQAAAALHKLRGAASVIGASRVASAAKDLEAALGTADRDTVSAAYGRFDASLAEWFAGTVPSSAEQGR